MLKEPFLTQILPPNTTASYSCKKASIILNRLSNSNFFLQIEKTKITKATEVWAEARRDVIKAIINIIKTMGVSKGHNGNKVENVFLINFLQSGSKLKKNRENNRKILFCLKRGFFFIEVMIFLFMYKRKMVAKYNLTRKNYACLLH